MSTVGKRRALDTYVEELEAEILLLRAAIQRIARTWDSSSENETESSLDTDVVEAINHALSLLPGELNAEIRGR